jgi:hypothetical protein
MKRVEIVLRARGERGKTMEGINLSYISTYVNITIYHPALLYANKEKQNLFSSELKNLCKRSHE